MNAAFFETTKDSITQRVHSARRKALSYNTAYPEYLLFGIDAYPSDVRNAHSKANSFGLFSGMGHGSATSFESQSAVTDLYDLTDGGSSNYTVRGAIVHLYSCNCGQKLGPYLVSIGAKAFIGYTSPVAVPADQNVVDEFVKVAAAVDRSILNGDHYSTTKTKADAEFAAVEAQLRAPGSMATARDVANFRVNHRAMVGPWSDSGRYGYY